MPTDPVLTFLHHSWVPVKTQNLGYNEKDPTVGAQTGEHPLLHPTETPTVPPGGRVLLWKLLQGLRGI